jgi:hypothetical protein
VSPSSAKSACRCSGVADPRPRRRLLTSARTSASLSGAEEVRADEIVGRSEADDPDEDLPPAS